jgi:hypothetical protein
MTTQPVKIVVTSYKIVIPCGPQARTPQAKKAVQQPTKLRTEERYAAKFEGDASVADFSVEGCHSPTAAVGALIRQTAQACETPDEVLDFLAGLLDDCTTRTPDVVLATWIRRANKTPKPRKHPGCVIEFPRPTTTAELTTAVKGGAA